MAGGQGFICIVILTALAVYALNPARSPGWQVMGGLALITVTLLLLTTPRLP